VKKVMFDRLILSFIHPLIFFFFTFQTHTILLCLLKVLASVEALGALLGFSCLVAGRLIFGMVTILN
jgi:hypothetical protein